MAKKISQLTQATEVKSDDVTVIVQDGETKKLPLNMMVTKQDIENKKVAGLAKLDEIEATYENDTYTPTITVKNKSSVKTGEGDEVDYSANVMDGHAKSAILKGQTLVNLIGERTQSQPVINRYSLKYNDVNKKYFIKYKCNYVVNQIGFSSSTTNWNTSVVSTVEEGYVILTPKTNLDITGVTIRTDSNTSTDIPIFNIICCEYQEGMENWNIPFFEGMQSVKMPVLTTTGKNLFDGEIEEGIIDANTGEPKTYGGRSRSKNFIRVPKNTDLYIKVENGGFESWTSIYGYDENKKYLGMIINSGSPSKTFNTGDASYIKWKNNAPMDTLGNIQLEEGSTPTSYEPYKSNILTVNEDIELRGIGDVQDTLDCLTGEITERIGEITLDVTDVRVHTHGNSDRFEITSRTLPKNNQYILKDYSGINNWGLTVINNYNYGMNNTISYHANACRFYIRFESGLYTAESLKQKLIETPLTLVYELETKSVKTVDLMPSGTHPSTTPYCWKNGHIQLSSSGLLPNLEYSVVTSRAGQINQNATMIVKNDKRIFDLEILLAGGLVNTTYQALTLQNQVETGLSKVSLSSETEPDYLLYHMIMKLIEEKAYKLDDLTEKVSVFYLYEKLSDEQFETIYSALYPFVEDEIVEEPVVEELPEVVEDEVIM